MSLPDRLRAWLPGNSFSRRLWVMVGSTGFVQVLGVLVAPILTRLYTPADFGLLGVFSSLLLVLGVLSSLRYELAVSLPEDDRQAASVVGVCLVLLGLSTTITAVVLAFFGTEICQLLRVPALEQFLWLLPIGLLLGGLYLVFNYWSIRRKNFNAIAGTKIWQGLATVLLQLIAFPLGGVALLCAQVAGHSCGAYRLGRLTLGEPVFRQISPGSLWQAFVEFRRFPLYSTPGALCNVIATSSMPIVLTILFSTAKAGLYVLASRILFLPASLVGAAISQVFLSHAVSAHRANKLGELVDQVQGRLISASLPFLIFVLLTAPDLFEIVFGTQWRQAGEFARIMAPWFFLQFISSPVSMLFTVIKQEERFFFWQLLQVALNGGAIVIGYWSNRIEVAVMALAAAGSISYGVMFCSTRIATGLNLIPLGGSLGKNLVACLLMSLPLLLAQWLQSRPVFWVALAITIGFSAVYYLRLAGSFRDIVDDAV